jgi:hypothetical protein
MTEEAPQRLHSLRGVCNGLRWLVRAGASWRPMPHDLPPWEAVSQQTPRWLNAGGEAIVQDWRTLLRMAEGRAWQPSAAIFARRTVPSTPASGPRAGTDGARRPRGRTVHMAVDTLGHLLAWHVTAATVPERTQGAEWAAQVQAGTGESVAVAFGEPGDTGEQPDPLLGLHLLAGVILLRKRFGEWMT